MSIRNMVYAIVNITIKLISSYSDELIFVNEFLIMNLLFLLIYYNFIYLSSFIIYFPHRKSGI